MAMLSFNQLKAQHSVMATEAASDYHRSQQKVNAPEQLCYLLSEDVGLAFVPSVMINIWACYDFNSDAKARKTFEFVKRLYVEPMVVDTKPEKLQTLQSPAHNQVHDDLMCDVQAMCT